MYKIYKIVHKIPSAGGAAPPDPAPRHHGPPRDRRFGAAAWYCVYILYILHVLDALDIDLDVYIWIYFWYVFEKKSDE